VLLGGQEDDTVSTTQTITVVFTDLVGSTELFSRLEPRADDELRRTHFGLLRSSIQATGGNEIKNLGDGLMVTFTSLSRALACAVGMQQSIEHHNRRSNVETLGLRIGLSTGETTEESGDYFGEPVVEAARLCGTARGGQILATELVRALTGRHSNQQFVGLGHVALKGLPDPVLAVEVVWEPVVTADTMFTYLEAAGEVVPLLAERVTVGRSVTNDVVLEDDDTVSRSHAALENRAQGWIIRDLNSANGTFVNNERLLDERQLQSEDEIRVGNSSLLFRARDLDASGEEMRVEPESRRTRLAEDNRTQSSATPSTESNQPE
jgi:class 3 adenylate cyclase